MRQATDDPTGDPSCDPSCDPIYEVVVVGGGVVGCAAARALSHCRVSVLLVDARPDVGAGTSKANTAILHTGFDATPGTTESRLVARGWHLLRSYAPGAGISVEETGAVLVAWDDEQAAALPRLADKAAANGYTSTAVVDGGEVRSLEPQLGPGLTGGLVVPDEHIIDPWTTPLAFAHDARANGATIETSFEVDRVDVGPEITELHATDGRVRRARFVVNAAGLQGDRLHRSFGLEGFTIRPRRGELIVFDKLARPLLHRTILPVPTSHTKGVLVAPTVFGNLMLGPTADDLEDREATGSTAGGLASLREKGHRILPALADEEVTAVYAGLRAATEHSDYQLSAHPDLRYVVLGGIRSTGLTASMALAEETLVLLGHAGLDVEAKDEIVTIRRTPLGERDERPFRTGGRIVCHCEHVTALEITAACTEPLPATDVDGLRRRTRTLAGRCQGFYCYAEVMAITGWDPAR